MRLSIKPKRIHNWHVERLDEGYCDSHGCTGHTGYVFVCSCGFTVHMGSQNSEQDVLHRHQFEILLQESGITFKERPKRVEAA